MSTNPAPRGVRWWPGREDADGADAPGARATDPPRPRTDARASTGDRSPSQSRTGYRSWSNDDRRRRVSGGSRYQGERFDRSSARRTAMASGAGGAGPRPGLAAFALFAVVLVGAVVAWRVVGGADGSSTGPGQPGEAIPAEGVGGLATAGSEDDEDDEDDEGDVSEGAAMIREENSRPGNPEWLIHDGDVRPRPIQGFTDRVSGQEGDTVRLFVTTESPSFTVVAYRMGFYNGAGARQIWASDERTGIDQPECLLDEGTRMVDCSNWDPSLSVPLTDDWVPGQYLFKLIQADGSATFVPFVVRDDESHSDILVISDVSTLQAYNTWGGYSLYTAVGGRPGGRATMVSYDRPMDMYWAQSGMLGDSYEVGLMIESLGLDVTYTTNIDQHQQPDLMKNHRAIVSGFHDEYYSLEMRDGLEAARDNGTNILFLGANAVYRRIRLEPSPLGPDRHQINYRTASADPLYGVDPERVTASWRDEPAARPESTLTGTYYECNEGGMKADMVIVDGTAWMFEGTNVTSGQHWPDMVQEEYDRVTPSAPTPPTIQVIAHSPLTCRGTASYSDMAYYTAPSGAGVFNVGTLGFEPMLGPLCPEDQLNEAHWQCQVLKMTANIITEFAKGPAGKQHPAEPNLDRLSITR